MLASFCEFYQHLLQICPSFTSSNGEPSSRTEFSTLQPAGRMWHLSVFHPALEDLSVYRKTCFCSFSFGPRLNSRPPTYCLIVDAAPGLKSLDTPGLEKCRQNPYWLLATTRRCTSRRAYHWEKIVQDY